MGRIIRLGGKMKDEGNLTMRRDMPMQCVITPKGQRNMTGKTGSHFSCGQRITENLFV